MSCRDEMNIAELARERRACETRPTTEPSRADRDPMLAVRGEHPADCWCEQCRPSE